MRLGVACQELSRLEDEDSGMRRIRWISGHTRRDKIKNEDIRGMVGVTSVVGQVARSETEMIHACEEEEHRYPSEEVREVDRENGKRFIR